LTTAALIQEDDPIEGRMKIRAVMRTRPRAWSPMKKERGKSLGIAAFFPIHRVASAYL
jgi:hypothetical protein